MKRLLQRWLRAKRYKVVWRADGCVETVSYHRTIFAALRRMHRLEQAGNRPYVSYGHWGVLDKKAR